jgi:hypothetical protein
VREERPERSSEADEQRLAVEGRGKPRREEAMDVVSEAEPSFFASPKRIIQTLVAVVLLSVAIYVLFPKVVGLEDALAKIEEGDPLWIALALVFNVAAFGAYVALFRGVVGEQVVHLEWRESYQITMAGLAATRLFSAGGAGGILLTYWAPLSVTLIAAILAAVVIAICLLIALLPDDFERRIEGMTSGRFGAIAKRLATAPATLASGTRTAIAFVRYPSRGGLAIAGAVGFW